MTPEPQRLAHAATSYLFAPWVDLIGMRSTLASARARQQQTHAAVPRHAQTSSGCRAGPFKLTFLVYLRMFAVRTVVCQQSVGWSTWACRAWAKHAEG